jgi:predicted membrane channel-forming protein YqfA (hemolysin III family)
MIGLGLVSLVRRESVPDLEPLPASLPGRPLIAMLAALLLVGAGTALVATWHTARAARTLGVVLSTWLVTLFVPQLVVNPQNGGTWVVFWEVAALSAAAWLFASATSEARADSPSLVASPRVANGTRIVFGLAFVAFGASHFVYHEYVEAVIPAWIPFHKFFAYATGGAHIAAGVSLLSRVREQLATALLAVMFGSWVLVLHVPRVIAAPRTGNEWTSLFIAVAMCGAALVFRGCLPAARPSAAHAETSTRKKLFASLTAARRSRP